MYIMSIVRSSTYLAVKAFLAKAKGMCMTLEFMIEHIFHL